MIPTKCRQCRAIRYLQVCYLHVHTCTLYMYLSICIHLLLLKAPRYRHSVNITHKKANRAPTRTAPAPTLAEAAAPVYSAGGEVDGEVDGVEDVAVSFMFM